MKSVLITLGVIVVLVLILGGSLLGSRNELVTEREAYKAQWQNVDVALQRRLDLIPNLVETVKGFAKQELSVFTEVAEARKAMMGAQSPAQRIAGSNQLEGALARLAVVVENYPQLKSNENFLRLQDELAGTENRIAVSRRDYNEAIKKYNTDVDLFPSNIAASLFGFHRDDAYFKTSEEDKKVPTVKF